MASIIKLEGAQCFRQRLVLSILSGKPIKIINIRANDDHPGLTGNVYIIICIYICLLICIYVYVCLRVYSYFDGLCSGLQDLP